MATNLKTVEKALDDLPKLNIAQRIAAVMGEVDYVQKEKKQGMNYSIVSHDAVTAKVRPLLHKHGIVYYPRALYVNQEGNRTEARFTVRFENIDERADYIDVETFGYGVDPQDKGPGKAMSYGVKYALLKVLGLETGDDPDTVQDNKADFRPTTDEPKPTKDNTRQPGDMSKSELSGSFKTLVRNINGCGSVRDLDELLELDDAKDVIEQTARRFPGWYATGEDCPPEFVPLKTLIAQTRDGLKALEPAE